MHSKYPEGQAVIKEIFHAAEEVLHHLGPGYLSLFMNIAFVENLS